MGHVPPRILCCTSSFSSASALFPGPQLEQMFSDLNLQTSQLIPHAPVGMILSLLSGWFGHGPYVLT
jgi:hypothetical protein